MSLTPTNKNNPCPICENASGNCRHGKEDELYIQCMTYADTKKGEIVGGYKCLGSTKDGMWGQFRIDNQQTYAARNRNDKRILQKETRPKSSKTQGGTRANTVPEIQGQGVDIPCRLEKGSSQDKTINQKFGWKHNLLNEERESSGRTREPLSLSDRDRQYREILAELETHPNDHADLERRGFSAKEREKWEGVSIEPYQRLRGNYSSNLPGFNGGKLTNAQAGYLCSIKNVDGLIVGFQYRLRTLPPGEKNRYRWLSNETNSVHVNGELPLAIHRPEGKPEGIALVEGTGAKPFLTSQRLNLLTVGAAGGQFTASESILKASLDKASEELGGVKELTIYPDAGDILNEQVMTRWQRTIALLGQWGWLLKVAWWGQKAKAALDIDELSDYSSIQYISVEEFTAIAEGEEKEKEASSQTASEWASDYISALDEGETEDTRYGWEDNQQLVDVQTKLRTLSYKPDLTLNCRYLPKDLLNQLPQSGLIAVKSPKDTGKSKSLCEPLIEDAKAKGIDVMSITPRIALGREQSAKWKITWIEDYGKAEAKAEGYQKQIDTLTQKKDSEIQRLKELEAQPQQIHLEHGLSKQEKTAYAIKKTIGEIEKQIDELEIKSLSTLGLCWDSLARITERNLKNSLMILDEVELGLMHLLRSKTCVNRRPEILKVFKDKLNEVVSTGGRVVILDADLTDTSIDYLVSLLDTPIKPFVVVNEYKGADLSCITTVKLGSKGCTQAEIIERLKMGEHLYITTDSKTEAKALERKIIKEIPAFKPLFNDTGEPPETLKNNECYIARIDSLTTATPAGRAFMEHPNESLTRLKPRCVIATPSMGVGVSIDKDTLRADGKPYFEAVGFLYFGVVEPSQFRQQMGRVRAKVERFGWCKTTGMPSTEGSQSCFPAEINAQRFNYQQSTAEIVGLAKAELADDATADEILEKMIQMRAEHPDGGSKFWKNPHIDISDDLTARNNYGKANLAALFIQELKEQGNEVFVIGGEADPITKEIKEIKDELKQEEAARIAAAPEITPEQAKEISRQATTTQTERDATQKAQLKEKIPGIDLTQEFLYKAVTKDRGKWLRGHTFFWLLKNPAIAIEKDFDRIYKKLFSFAKGTPFAPDIYTDSPKIAAITATGLLDFVDLDNPDKIYQGNSQEAKAFLRRYNKAKKQLNTAFGRTEASGKGHPILYANNLLGKMGLKLKKVTKSKKDNRYQIDKALLEDGDRHAVLEALSKAWGLLQQKLDVCDSSTEVDLEKIYADHPEWQNSPNQYTEGAKVGGEVAVYIKHSDDFSPQEKARNECASLRKNEIPLVTEELEKAKDEDGSLVIGGLYRVRELVGSFGTVATQPSIAWIVGCKLDELPSQFRDYYTFSMPDGSRRAVQEGEFEPETEPAGKSLGERFLDALRMGLEAFRELLRGMNQVDAWTALDEAERLSPGEIERLPVAAPDWLLWMPT